MKKFAILAFLSLSFGLLGANEIEISNAFARATPPSVTNSAAFMDIKNNSNADIKLLSATSDISEVVEIHNHIHEDGMMKMIQVDGVKIPAKSEVSLMPGGLHIMFIGLKNPVNEGDKINLVLEFDNGAKIEVNGIEARSVKKPMHQH